MPDSQTPGDEETRTEVRKNGLGDTPVTNAQEFFAHELRETYGAERRLVGG